ncbi:GH25 family lysozyme, partial [Acaricomes phytoseiuli]
MSSAPIAFAETPTPTSEQAAPTQSAKPDQAPESPAQSPEPSALPEAPRQDPTQDAAPSSSNASKGSDSIVLPSGEVVTRPEGPGATMNAGRAQAQQSPGVPMRSEQSTTGPAAESEPLSAPVTSKPAGTENMPGGVDVSGWQQNVNWQMVWNQGARFAYIKASEGPWRMNDYFAQQYNGSYSAGMIRGAYHFARPNLSSGAAQARVFVQSGGGWSADGRTLPGALDLETNYSDNSGRCFGMSPGQLTAWTSDFVNTYRGLTGRDPAIYTAYFFWRDCMGNPSTFSQSSPLWIAAYGAAANNVWMPGGWPRYTFWQFSENGPYNGGDSNVFNGSMDGLRQLAWGNDVQGQIARVASANRAALGNATSGVICGLKDGGCYQAFQRGFINWSPNTGAQPSPNGGIRNRWASMGYESGPL